jgi:dTDP-glucose 4,6-dehydratase
MAPFRPACLLVTGGAGFIGSNFVRWVLQHDPHVVVVNLDALTYAGNLESLADVTAKHGADGDGRYFFLQGDTRDVERVTALLQGTARETVPAHERARPRPVPPPNAVVHMAAESHVDRSIIGPGIFVDTNIRGTLNLIEALRAELLTRPRDARFVHVSTDEVYGALGPDDMPFTERTPLSPNSPYAASKAGSDLLVRAYVETFQLPAVVTRCSNNYGPYQFPEKLIPLMITRALRDETLPVYGDGRNVRDWIHVDDHAAALWEVLRNGSVGNVYNIGGDSQMQNIDVVRRVLQALGKPESLIRFVPDRLGHDRRYAVDSSRLKRELGWRPSRPFDEGLRDTIQWYCANESWWNRVLTEAYRAAASLYLSP